MLIPKIWLGHPAALQSCTIPQSAIPINRRSCTCMVISHPSQLFDSTILKILQNGISMAVRDGGYRLIDPNGLPGYSIKDFPFHIFSIKPNHPMEISRKMTWECIYCFERLTSQTHPIILHRYDLIRTVYLSM